MTRKLMLKSYGPQRLKRLWVLGGGEPGKTPPWGQRITGEDPLGHSRYAPSPKPMNWRAAEFERWSRQPAQGAGIKHFKRDKISNDWLKFPTGFSQGQLRTALKMQANVVPTRLTLARTKPGNVKSCRRCGSQRESL